MSAALAYDTIPAPPPDHMEENSLKYTVRPARPTDVPFIMESWLKSNRHSPAGCESGPSYVREMKTTIADILERTGVHADVACDPTDDDAIYGFAVYK